MKFQTTSVQRLAFSVFSLLARPKPIALILFLGLGAIGLLNDYHPDAPLKNDGKKYDLLIREYIASGYHFADLKAPYLAHDQTETSYTGRILFIWLAARLAQVTGLSLPCIYPILIFIGCVGTAYFLFLIAFKQIGLPLVPALFPGIYFLILPNTTLMYHILAHPESLATLLTALAFYYYGGQRHIAAAVVLMLGMLAKQSILFLFIYICLATLLGQIDAPANRPKLRLLAPYFVAMALAILTVKGMTGHLRGQFRWGTIQHIQQINHERFFHAIVANFDILWTPWLFYWIHEPRRRKLAIFFMLALSLPVMMCVVVDWFRGWHAFLFVFVIPGAVAGIHQTFARTIGPRNTPIPLFLVALLLLKSSHRPNIAILTVTGVIFCVNLYAGVYLQRLRARLALVLSAAKQQAPDGHFRLVTPDKGTQGHDGLRDCRRV